ncbi:putative uncharacterized protein FLJ45035 like protein [Argiope bruennichi]|uniref:Uncharacterized protein n=1 Tax=Argiope bruennichi TaxID=94029 RepID=A0A8T0F8C6_ARGBR|nr:putative uncharacterized protein FLJ45035 like protein [Argiope bruennichi]
MIVKQPSLIDIDCVCIESTFGLSSHRAWFGECMITIIQEETPVDSQNFKTHKEFTLQVYNLPPPTPAHECEPPTKKLKTTFVEPSPVHQTFVEPSPVHQTFVEPSPVPETFVEPSPLPETFVEPSPLPETFVEPSPLPQTFVEPSPVPEIDFSLEREEINNFLEIFGRDLFQDSPAAVLPPSHDSPAAVLPPSHDSPAAVLSPSHDSPAAVLPPQDNFWNFHINNQIILPPPTILLPPDNEEEGQLLNLTMGSIHVT